MDKAKSYLGFARKSGNLVLGEERCGEAATEGRLKLLLLASDASDNARRRAEGYTVGHRFPLMGAGMTKEELCSLLGSGGCAMVGFTEWGLASQFASAMAGNNSDWQETAALLAQRRDKAARRKAAPRKHKSNGAKGGNVHGN